jgi:hypothetical protein
MTGTPIILTEGFKNFLNPSKEITEYYLNWDMIPFSKFLLNFTNNPTIQYYIRYWYYCKINHKHV